MKTLFPKTRIVLQAVAAIWPFLALGYISSYFDHSLYFPLILLVCILFPIDFLLKPDRFSGRRMILFVKTAKIVAYGLSSWAVFTNPIFREISQRLADQRAFYDWRFVTAAIVITVVFSVQQVMKVRAWDDRRIYDLIRCGADSQSSESAERL